MRVALAVITEAAAFYAIIFCVSRFGWSSLAVGLAYGAFTGCQMLLCLLTEEGDE